VGERGIVLIRYDFETRAVSEVPRSLLRYRGANNQSVVGLAPAPEGLFVVPLFADNEGNSTVLQMRYDVERGHPHLVLDSDDGLLLFINRGCVGCHAVLDRRQGTSGPPLDPGPLVERITARLSDPAYAARSAALDTLDEEPFRSFREARREVLAAEGRERVALWITHRIREPRFDDPNAIMPNLGLTAGEASRIADFLLNGQEAAAPPGLIARFRDWLPTPRYEFIALAFVLGVVSGVVAILLFRRFFRPRRAAG
jgi:hypothetical protein